MSKPILAALLAALTLGAAQAVTIDWQPYGETLPDGSSYATVELGSALTSATWAVKGSITLSSTTSVPNDSWPVLFGVGGSGNDGRFVFNSGSGALTFSNGGSSGLANGTATGITLGNQTISFVVSANADGTVSVFFGDATTTDLTFTPSGTKTTLSFGGQNGSRNLLSAIATWEVTDLAYVDGMTYEEILAATETPDPDPGDTNVPEPTALALLALGAAGLALRRRLA